MVRGGLATCELPGAVTDASADAGAVGDPDAVLNAPPDGSVDAGTLDRDHDGIVDTLDDCPDVPDPAQADEDGDHLGDVCDPCPPFSNNTDTDGDGLGDACDPNPTVPGDQLVHFEGFAGALSASWTTVGNFSTQGGNGVAKAPDGTSTILAIASPAAARVEIRAALVLDTINSTGLNLGAIGLVDRLQPGTDKAVTCQLAALTGATQPVLRIFDTATGTAVSSATHPVTLGSEIELRLRRDGTTYACHATSPALEITGSDTFSPASPQIGLRLRNANGRAHWVMIVTSP